ncbi:hypothetical protein [Glutamicibacter ardleyensis]|uniref:hypothetical protein n=1 Tax=Glutamicibacter ardleyensis TaxID=225894 RepID=UPI003FD46CD9
MTTRTASIRIQKVCVTTHSLHVHYQNSLRPNELFLWAKEGEYGIKDIPRDLVVVHFLIDCVPRWIEETQYSFNIQSISPLPFGVKEILDFLLFYDKKILKRLILNASSVKYYSMESLVIEECRVEYSGISNADGEAVSVSINLSMLDRVLHRVITSLSHGLRSAEVAFPSVMLWTVIDSGADLISGWPGSKSFLRSFERACRSVFGCGLRMINTLEGSHDFAEKFLDEKHALELSLLSDDPEAFREVLKLYALSCLSINDLSQTDIEDNFDELYGLREFSEASEVVRRSLIGAFPSGSDAMVDHLARKLHDFDGPHHYDHNEEAPIIFWTSRGYARLGNEKAHHNVWGRVVDHA